MCAQHFGVILECIPEGCGLLCFLELFFLVVCLSCTGVKKIPTACITVEDAEMMTRMAARGTKIVVNLKMEAKTLPPAISRNTVAEVKGSVYPEQVFDLFLDMKLVNVEHTIRPVLAELCHKILIYRFSQSQMRSSRLNIAMVIV